jgi:hypothetical protein
MSMKQDASGALLKPEGGDDMFSRILSDFQWTTQHFKYFRE